MTLNLTNKQKRTIGRSVLGVIGGCSCYLWAAACANTYGKWAIVWFLLPFAIYFIITFLSKMLDWAMTKD